GGRCAAGHDREGPRAPGRPRRPRGPAAPVARPPHRGRRLGRGRPARGSRTDNRPRAPRVPMTRARQWSEAALAVTGIGLARVIPRRVLHGFGRLVGAALGRVDTRHTGIARDNLDRALSDALDRAARERVLRACWRHFGGITLDALAFRDVAREAA